MSRQTNYLNLQSQTELSESSDNDESTFSITLALDSIVVLISEVVTFVEDSSSLDDSPSDSEKTVVLSSFFSASDSFSDFTGTIFSSLSRSVPDSEEDEEDESDELDESDQPSEQRLLQRASVYHFLYLYFQLLLSPLQ